MLGIVITSLGSSDSELSPEPRSPSPNTKRFLSQPGAQGFTLSPSLLTHLLSSRDQILRPPVEKGMVLYRPPARFGHFPGNQIVNEWNGELQLSEEPSRFEEIDEDEDLRQEPHPSADVSDISMDVEQEPPARPSYDGAPGDVEMAMDLE